MRVAAHRHALLWYVAVLLVAVLVVPAAPATNVLAATVTLTQTADAADAISASTAPKVNISGPRASTITANGVNSPPVNSVPGPQMTPGNTPLIFSTANGNPISIADPDAGSGLLQVTLFVTGEAGDLAMGSTTNLIVDGDDTNTIVATGTLADLNAGLQGLTYTPLTNLSGIIGLTIETNDQGNTGTGGAQQDQDTVQITIGDLPVLAIDDPAGVAEGNSGAANSIVFTVTLTPASNLTVTVPYTTTDSSATGGASCTAGVDYLTTAGTLSFGPGQTSKPISVPICGDGIAEGDETLRVDLGIPENAVAPDTEGIGTIVDDETAPALRIGDATVLEGDAGTSTLTFTVTLAPPATGAVAVPYFATDGTATGGVSCSAGVDYLATTGTLNFAPTETTRTVSVTVCGDTSVEGDETVLVTLGIPIGAGLADGQGIGTISNDDTGGTVAFSAAAVQVPENAGTVSLMVQRAGGGSGGTTSSALVNGGRLSTMASSAITVTYATANGTAIAGQDYTATSGTLSFGVGETTKTIAVPILTDGEVESPETFTVSLSGPAGGASLGSPSTVTVTIVDSTPAAPQVKQSDDDTDKPRKQTEEQRQQHQHTNTGNRDDLHTEGNVIEVHQDEQPAYVVIANKDGLVRVNLLCGSQCPTIRVGDYLEVDGEKQNEVLFDATDVTVKHAR